MRHPKTIVHRSNDFGEHRWLVMCSTPEIEDIPPFIACGPRNGEKRFFPTIAQACDYARSRVPEEATC